jgi:pimeloyl-ACP methyl ester carboxylesterase
VIQILLDRGFPVIASANPCRSVSGDSAYLASILATIHGPIVLVGHSYGGMLISQAAIGNSNVRALVYVDALAPESGESVVDLAGRFPGSTLGDTLVAYPIGPNSTESVIALDKYHAQFVADAPADVAMLMAVGQRPITDAALNEKASSDAQAWKTKPSWFVFGGEDKNLPPAVHRFMAGRADARRTEEVPGGSHALGVAHPGIVADVILEALSAANELQSSSR